MSILLSIITINFNGVKDTCALLDSIPFGSCPLEVIVVDNASRQDEVSVIAARYPQVRVVRSEQNLGFAGGNNLGIRAARGKYLYFVNNDTEFRGEWNIEKLIARLESSPSIGMVCPKIRFAWGKSPIQFAGYTPLTPVTMRNRALGYNEDDKGQHDSAHATPYAHGAAMMLKREVIEKAGMMPECYFLYYEELDWSCMIRRAGYEIWYEPASTIYHKESQTTGQASPLRTYYISRNRLLFVSRNGSGLYKYLSYCYLTFVVALRDIAMYTLKGRTDLAKSAVRGIVDFFKMK